jgi:drug/metabolite transporter (DMT)-like permease
MFLHKRSMHYGAFALAMFASVLLGTNAVATKIAVETMDPLFFTALRHVFIGVLLLLFVKDFSFLKSKRIMFHVLLSSSLGLILISFFVLGVEQSTAIKASVLSLIVPVLVYFFSITLLHEPVIKRVIIGGVIAILGSLMIVGLPALMDQSFSVGDVYLMTAYIALALLTIHTKYTYKWLTPNQILSSRITIAGTILLVYVLLINGFNVAETGDTRAWISMLYSVVISGVIGATVYYRALSRMRAENVAPIFYIDPLVGVFAASVMLGERLDMYAIIGSVIILIGVMTSHAFYGRLMHKLHVPHIPHDTLLHRLLRRLGTR